MSRSVSLSVSSRWLAVALVLIGANLRAPITGLGPLLGDIQRDLHLHDGGAGWLNALPLLVFAALSLVAPRAGRRYGLERVLGASLAAIFAGTLLRSVPLQAAVWAGTLLLSSGIAFGNVLLPGLVKRDFPARAPMLIGCYAAAMAGVAGLSAGLAVPLARLPGWGWRGSLGCWAILAALTLLLWLPQLRKTSLPAARAVSSPARARSPWRHPVGWQVSLFFATHSLVFYALVDWFPTYAASSGIPLATSGVYLLVYQVVAVLTNLGSASVIRRFRDQKGLGLACGLALVAGTTGLLMAPALSLAWLVLAGLGAGIAMVTSLSLFALRTTDHHEAARLSGMAQFIGYAGAAAGPLLVGVVRQVTGAWTAPFMLLVGASMLVTVFATLAGRNRTIG